MTRGWGGWRKTPIPLIPSRFLHVAGFIMFCLAAHSSLLMIFPALINLSLQFCLMQQRCCQFLDGFAGGIEIGDSFPTHQYFRFAYFILAVLDRGIFAIRLALLAHTVQPQGINGKAE